MSKTQILKGALGCDIAGAATSASSMKCKVGVRDMTENGRVFINGEGWVKWIDIKRQIEQAFRDWRHRKAMQGVFISDDTEAREQMFSRREIARKNKLTQHHPMQSDAIQSHPMQSNSTLRTSAAA